MIAVTTGDGYHGRRRCPDWPRHELELRNVRPRRTLLPETPGPRLALPALAGSRHRGRRPARPPAGPGVTVLDPAGPGPATPSGRAVRVGRPPIAAAPSGPRVTESLPGLLMSSFIDHQGRTHSPTNLFKSRTKNSRVILCCLFSERIVLLPKSCQFFFFQIRMDSSSMTKIFNNNIITI